MMVAIRIILCLAAFIPISSDAIAQGDGNTPPTVTVTLMSSLDYEITKTYFPTNTEWRIAVLLHEDSIFGGVPEIIIVPAVNNQRLIDVVIRNNTHSLVRLRIPASGGGNRFDYCRDGIRWDPVSVSPIVLTQLQTSGYVGPIEINSINGAPNGDVDIGGDLTGDITIFDSSGLTKVISMIVRGDLLGDIDAPTGSGWSYFLQDLVVDGDVGTSTNPVSIKGRGRIRNLQVGGHIYADIDQLAYGQYDIGRIVAASGFTGSLTARQLFFFMNDEHDAGMFITEGDLDADISLLQPLTHDIIVGGSFASEREIDLPEDGLQAQIVFNNLDDGGEWDGDVLIDGVPLSNQPNYTDTAASIGGGAAGLAPFTHHGSSCVPTDGATIFIKSLDIFDPEEGCQDNDFTQAKARLYGPVELVGAAPHVEVLVWSGSAYVDAGFTVVTSIVSDTGDREVLVKRSGDLPWPEGEYRIVPLEGKMTSKGVEGDPDVDMFEYEFTLADGCGMMLLQNFDFNEDDTVCELDFIAWSSDPCDLNGDEVVDCDDIALLLSAIDLYETITAE